MILHVRFAYPIRVPTFVAYTMAGFLLYACWRRRRRRRRWWWRNDPRHPYRLLSTTVFSDVLAVLYPWLFCILQSNFPFFFSSPERIRGYIKCWDLSWTWRLRHFVPLNFTAVKSARFWRDFRPSRLCLVVVLIFKNLTDQCMMHFISKL